MSVESTRYRLKRLLHLGQVEISTYGKSACTKVRKPYVRGDTVLWYARKQEIEREKEVRIKECEKRGEKEVMKKRWVKERGARDRYEEERVKKKGKKNKERKREQDKESWKAWSKESG